MSIVSLLGAREQHATNVRLAVAFTFDQTVASFDPNVVSYWKFQNTGTDEKGIANATLNGAPEPNIPTIVKNDSIATGALIDGTCIAWSNLAGDFAQAAHNAAHKTASGTIVVYFQRDAALAKSQLIDADSASAIGGMQMGINSSGAPDAYIRDGFGTPIPLTGAVNGVVLDRAYALILKWGAPGIALVLWDDTGAQVSRSTNPSTIGLSGTSTIRFGATHTNTNHHDGPYGRVIWMNRRITIDEEVVLARATSIARSVDLYRTLELGMVPISLWGMGEPGGLDIVDSAGPRTGAFSGTVQYNAMDLPDDSINGAINFAGTGAGTVQHTAALDLEAFTLSFWFRANTIPGPSEAALALVTKNTPLPESAGDFLVYIPSNDQRFLKVRFRSAPSPAVPLDINTPADSILAGNTYHVCVRADNTGFDLFVNGAYHGKNTGYTGAWTVNTAALQFADSPTFTAIAGDVALDEIALFNRVLTIPEVLQLAQQTGAPVASDDAAAVPEGQPTAIQVLANDIYIGTPTIDIMAPPTPDDAQVVPAVGATPAFINYVAGGVAVDTVRSFQYRITDPNGISNTATVTVTVIAEETVAVTNANCYVIPAPGGATTTNVGIAALEATVNGANAGDHIVINNGTWAGGTMTFTAAGTAALPLVIRGQSRAGVIINNALWNLSAASARIVITNITFHNARIIVRGPHHRITRCKFDQVDRITIDVFNATDLRCDHCDFSDYTDTPPDNTNLTVRRFFRLDDANVGSGACKRILFDYNYVHDVLAHIDPSRDMELVGLSASSNGAATTNAEWIVDHCLFDNISLIGEGETLGAKCSGTKVQFSTFTNGGNSFLNAPRQGNDWEIRSCWFENNQVNYCRAASDDVLVIGNRFIGGQNLLLLAGTRYGATPIGTTGGNPAVRNGRVIGNVLDTGQIRIGHEFQGPSIGADPWDTPVLNTNVCPATGSPTTTGANTRAAGAPVHVTPVLPPPPGGGASQGPGSVGTTFQQSNLTGDEAFVPAIKLLPVHVGMAAPDPLCSSGPQN